MDQKRNKLFKAPTMNREVAQNAKGPATSDVLGRSEKRTETIDETLPG